MSEGLTLRTQRRIAASAERLFDAWTDPEQLTAWWGPAGVCCPAASVDLRVGGAYRIENLLPDGSTVVIEGEFVIVERPRRLVYTWHVRPGPASAERVTVAFDPVGDETDVVITHEKIPDPPTRDDHASGWRGCLEGLAAHLGRLPASP